MTESSVELILGDCLEVMKGMPDNSFDAVITDPPYGTQDGKGKVVKRGNKIVEFNSGKWDENLPLEWIASGMHLLKNGKWIVVFTDKLSVSTVWDEMEKYDGRGKNTFYWIKPNKAPTPRKNYKSCVETAVVATKNAVKYWYGGGCADNYFISPFETDGLHPTQKSVSVMKYLIGKHTEKGDTVLDPFMGSGTTGVACVQTGRNFVGIEINEDYFKIAERRIKEAQMQPRLL